MKHPSLPPSSTPFVGRDAELAQIRQWFEDPTCRLLALVGLGGIGRTRLAIEAARQNLDHFPDGVSFVPLHPLELPKLLLPAVADAVRLAASSGVDLEQQLVGRLDGKRLLVVLNSLRICCPASMRSWTCFSPLQRSSSSSLHARSSTSKMGRCSRFDP
jgi:hypothetical protein